MNTGTSTIFWMQTGFSFSPVLQLPFDVMQAKWRIRELQETQIDELPKKL
jgi:hypothetical protein